MKTKLLLLSLAFSSLLNGQNIVGNFSVSLSCPLFPTCFTDLSTSGNGPITMWNWDFGDGNNNYSTLQNPCHSYLNAGSYSVTLIVTNSNGNKDTVEHFVIVGQFPTAEFSSSIDSGGVKFTDLSLGSISQWQWSFPNGTPSSATQQNPSIITFSSGTSQVRLVVITANGCPDTVSHEILTSSIKEIYIDDIGNVFPNPFSTQTTIYSRKDFKDATLKVYNSLGQAVKQIKNLSGQTITLNRDNLSNGQYFLRLTQDNKIFLVDKLIITDN